MPAIILPEARVEPQESLDSRSDLQLIAAINADDAAAFESLYFRHRDWVVGLAYRFTGNEDLALDVMQETFLYFLKKFPGFQLTAKLRTFLYPAVKNFSIAARRKTERYQSSEAEQIFLETSVNRYLLDHMAKQGRGAVAYLGPRDDAAQVMEDFFNRISHPALTDVQIDWGAMQVSEVFPRAMPDLFVGRPVILTGRCAGDADTAIRVSGRAANVPVSLVVPADLSQASGTHSELSSVWARMKIAKLADESTYAPNAELPEHIKQVALDYGLMSAFTAFVAVDSSRQAAGTEGVTVPVAVPVPAGVKYKTTVPEN